MPLRRKLLFAMLAPVALLGLVALAGIAAVRHLQVASGRILADNYESIEAARAMERALRRVESAADRTAALADFDAALARCERNVTEPGEPAVLAQLRTGHGALAADAQPDGTGAVLHTAIDELIALNEAGMLARAQAAREQGGRLTAGLAVTMGVVVAGLVALAAWLARLIANEQRALEAARQRFIATLSHQLKTPLTSLSMAVNLLAERVDRERPETAELLAIAREGTAALSAQVAELIDAAHRPAAALEVRAEPVELAGLLRRALRPLVSQGEARGIAVTLAVDETPLPVAVDPVKFPWVVTNIVGNALRFTPAGGRIDVTVRRDGAEAEVVIGDTGVGIAPADLPRIFVPSAPAPAGPARATHGLGLAIAREIVEAHRGRIQVASTPHVGTTFRIRIPCAAEGA